MYVLLEKHLSTFLQTSQRIAQLRLPVWDETEDAVVGMLSRWEVREALCVADTQQREDRCPGDTRQMKREPLRLP